MFLVLIATSQEQQVHENEFAEIRQYIQGNKLLGFRLKFGQELAVELIPFIDINEYCASCRAALLVFFLDLRLDDVVPSVKQISASEQVWIFLLTLSYDVGPITLRLGRVECRDTHEQ